MKESKKYPKKLALNVDKNDTWITPIVSRMNLTLLYELKTVLILPNDWRISTPLEVALRIWQTFDVSAISVIEKK